MKKILFLIWLFLGVLLFASQKEDNSNNSTYAVCESIMKEKNSVEDVQHQLVVISNDLKTSNCLTPRRNVQSINSNFNIQVFKSAERFIRSILLKETEQLQKVFEHRSFLQAKNRNSLLCSMGYHVYALRKIII